MNDTAQPQAAETDPIAGAMQAFKASLGQAPGPGDKAGLEAGRDGRGRFASPDADEAGHDQDPGSAAPAGAGGSGTGIDAAAGGDEPAAGAESREAGEEEEAAADEAQPADAALPTSWPAERAELWEALPPEARAFIAEREGQRDAAVNAKFQEAANLRKAAEEKAAAEIIEAQTHRGRYAEAVDLVMSLVVPQMPPRSMLDVESGDYDPDAYHFRKAQYEETVAFLNQHKAQRDQVLAQEQVQRFQAIEGASRDSFIELVPDAADRARAPAVFAELMEYAVAQGAPAEIFQEPTTALEWKIIWKAKEYDRLQSARARVKDSRPEPRKAQPAVRPGVTTPKSAIEQARYAKARTRLDREGSVEAGAAIWKHHLKGMT